MSDLAVFVLKIVVAVVLTKRNRTTNESREIK